MSVLPNHAPHPAQAHYDPARYAFYELRDEHGTYAHAAVSEHEDCLELHLEVVRWGPRSRRAMVADLEWLKDLARERGLARIVGVRQEADGQPDPLWAKFTRLYGFTGQNVLQTAWLDL